MTMDEARRQRTHSGSSSQSQDDNDITRAILASMGGMGENLAMAAQSFQDSGKPGGGSGGAQGFREEDIPGCSTQGGSSAMGSMFTQGIAG